MSRLLTDLTPETLMLANAFHANCIDANIDYLVTCTLRTFAEQDALYAEGRTAPGHIVTWAQAGQSPHNFGLAFDMVPLRNGKPVWDANDPIWAQITSIVVVDEAQVVLGVVHLHDLWTLQLM